MNGKQLKNSILQWAIQGKLVPQDPNDEPASVLLEKIRAEKARLVKEGKIKKDKKESIIYRGEDNSYYEKFADGKVVCIDDEIPFEIPQGWELARFGSVMYNRDSERIPLSVAERNKLTKIYDYYGASGVIDKVDKYLFNKDLLLIGEDGANLINRSKPIAYIATGKYWVNNHAHVLDCIDSIFMQYICLYINSISLVDYVTGTAQPKMNQEKMNSILLVLPPHNEQKRILQKVDKIQPLYVRYEKNKSRLEALTKTLYTNLRKSILQEAMQGKLIPQDPNDEPASVLLQRIREERLKLVKDGKLKKKDIVDSLIFKGDDNKYYEQVGKSITEITEEIPFSIPDSWTWSRLSGVAKIIMGQSPDGNDVFEAEKEDNAYEFHQGKIYFTEKYISPSGKWCKNPPRIANIGSLLVCIRAPIGDVNIVQRQIAIGRGLAAIIGYAKIKTDFLYYWILAHKKNLIEKGTGSTFKAITLDVLKDLIIPIPPLAEQKRISSRIELLYNKIENN
ncbi:restriction endonuclease subunit S [Prevotella veroralis]|uniref:Type I restriction modification DNA specificity domain protein n=1 Tax=Prevotella veroralis F0319 TaxID=649761 RepID=C9MRT8_9BACT|nr:restriction endonuclease subunit S [Prevotella veroralis]EEX17796.1 type I restriction modification DNA specificity domain protein [Prevotella veroralis F0319]